MTLSDYATYATVAAIIALCVYGHTGGRDKAPEKAPQRPQDASAEAEWLLLPFQLIAGLAGLCWCLVGLVVFLSPLLILAALALVVLR